MSGENWTKGPWLVTEAHDNVSVAMGEAIDSPYEYCCSHLWSCPDVYWSEADDEDRGNAHLIAAAPDLYTALSDLVSSYEALGSSLPLGREIEIALDAMAKARGEDHG